MADDFIREASQDKTFGKPIVTEVLPLANYWPAEDYHQDYFENNPNQGYCAFVVGPKVEKFRKTFASRVQGLNRPQVAAGISHACKCVSSYRTTQVPCARRHEGCMKEHEGRRDTACSAPIPVLAASAASARLRR